MIDTHVHFNSKGLSSEWREALDRASGVGVESCVVVGYDLQSSAKGVELSEADPRLWATVGIHPHDATSWSDEVLEKLRAWLAYPRVVALGEIGLDFYRDLSPRPDQYRAFSAQLALARETGSTVILHCRDAYDECLEVLEAEAVGLTVILHCFLGDRAQAERAWAKGWFIGVDGPVTYKKNDALREIIAACPEELLLLETDAPWLSPEPFRGKFPNEPARLEQIRQRVAEVRNTTVSAVDSLTTENARRAFPRIRGVETSR